MLAPRPMFSHVSRLATLAAVLATLQAAPVAAVPFTSDLSATGTLTFDSGFATGELSGSGAQSGTMDALAGGVAGSSAYSQDTVATSPFASVLTDFGDGIGITGSASAGSAPGTYGTGIDLLLSILNNSATNSYRVTFGVSFDHSVDASGDDAFSDSEFSLSESGSEVFFTDLVSDTVNGNTVNGAPAAGPGGPLGDSGATSFSFDIAPLATLDIGGFWTLRGGSFGTAGTALASLGAFLSIDNVELLNQPPNPTPIPGTLALLAGGLIAASAGARRKKARPA